MTLLLVGANHWAWGEQTDAPATEEAPTHTMRNYRNVTYQKSPFNYIRGKAWITSLISSL